MFVLAVAALSALFSAAIPASAQTAPSFAAASAYNMQPGTVPIGVATGVFNNSSGGLMDFAVLEQIPSSGSYQVEIFHGASNGTFCTNCSNANPNPDLIPLGSGVKGNAISTGQFRSSGPTDIAVATSTGIIFLENNDAGTFQISPNAITSTNGFLALTIGLFNGDTTPDITAVAPAVNGSVSFSVYFGNGDGTFNLSASYPISSPWNGCSEILPGNFQNQVAGSDLALLCRTPSAAGVLVYLNAGSSKSYSYSYFSTPYSGSIGGGVLPTPAVGTLNGQATIFVSSFSQSFLSYQSNGAGVFTSVSMVPVGLAPHGAVTILSDTSAAVDFTSGPAVSTFTAFTQSGTFVDGTWNSTGALGPAGQTIATGSSNLTQGTTYVVVDAGVSGGSYSDPNVTGFPNFIPYVDERAVSVYLVTLNADGTVRSTNAAPIYSGTGGNGYSAPATFTTGDFNGDGIMDLAVGGADGATGNASATIYLANSDGSLPSTTSLAVVTVNNTNYSGADAVVAGKFRPAQSGKTLYDLAVFSSGEIAVFTSNGDGTFNSSTTYPLSGDANYPGFYYNPGAGRLFAPVLTAADVNGDGLDDIVLTLPEDNCAASGSTSQGAVYILISNGDGTFQNPVFVAPPVENPVSVVAAKFFGSSLPDLAFANGGEICRGNSATTEANEVAVLQNKVTPGATTISAANFTPGVILASTRSTDPGVPNVTSLATGDFNGDGFPDLVVSNNKGIQILLNSGTGSFSATAQGLLPFYAGDTIPGLLCNSLENYAGCITNDAQVTTGSFFAAGETDVAAAVSGVVYVFQNNAGILTPPAQGFVASTDSRTISGALTGPKGLNNLLVATSTGTANLTNSGSAGGPAIATFVPYAYGTSIDFGTVEIGQSSPDEILELFNGGTGPLHLYLISLIDTSSRTIQSAPFVLNSIFCNVSPGAPVSIQEPVSSVPNLTLQPGIACDFLLTMQPTAQGTYTGTFNFLDNAAQTNAAIQAPNGQNFAQTIQLTGTAPAGQPYATFTANGIPTPSNGLLLQDVPINSTQSRQLTVTNTGNGLLTLDLVYFNLLPPSTANGFSYTQVLCGGAAASFPVSLLPSQSCTVTLQFTATAGGTFSTNLYFLDNAGAGESNITSSGTSPNFVQAYSLSASVSTPTADVSIIGEPGPSLNPTTESPFVFTLGMLDSGPNVATNPALTFGFSSPVLFDGLIIQGGSTPNCVLPAIGSSVTSFTCKYSGASLAPGYPAITALTITPTTSGRFTLTTTISADQIDPNLSNNTI
ncbi:MAG: beta strand repeat-containing protein, partial [Candidatus Acidiferrales bacterium]